MLPLSPLIISLSSCAAYCCARRLQRGKDLRKSQLLHLQDLLLAWWLFALSFPLSTALPLLFPPLVKVLWCTLSSRTLFLSLSVPVFSSAPFGAQWLSPPHCLRSALPIAALSLMCYYQRTQLTGIPYLPTRALASSPFSLPIPLSFSLPQPLPAAEQSANAAAAARPSSSPLLSVSLRSPSLCLLIHVKQFHLCCQGNWEAMDEFKNIKKTKWWSVKVTMHVGCVWLALHKKSFHWHSSIASLNRLLSVILFAIVDLKKTQLRLAGVWWQIAHIFLKKQKLSLEWVITRLCTPMQGDQIIWQCPSFGITAPSEALKENIGFKMLNTIRCPILALLIFKLSRPF